jgi:hypothetical protein
MVLGENETGFHNIKQVIVSRKFPTPLCNYYYYVIGKQRFISLSNLQESKVEGRDGSLFTIWYRNY